MIAQRLEEALRPFLEGDLLNHRRLRRLHSNRLETPGSAPAGG
jgi:hypothetical protein